jgi:hypothetical protein
MAPMEVKTLSKARKSIRRGNSPRERSIICFCPIIFMQQNAASVNHNVVDKASEEASHETNEW